MSIKICSAPQTTNWVGLSLITKYVVLKMSPAVHKSTIFMLKKREKDREIENVIEIVDAAQWWLLRRDTPT